MSKITFLSRLYWPHMGGVEKHVEKLCQELLERGHQVVVVTEQYDTSLPTEQKHHGVKIFRIPKEAVDSKVKLWQWMWRNRKLFFQADIVHAHDVLWWYWPLKLLKPTKSVFTTFHGYEGSEPPTWKAVAHRKLNELLSSKTICIGEFMKKWYKVEPDEVMYGAAEMAPKEEQVEETAVFLGRLAEDTGIMTYLDALKVMKEPMPLSIYGEGEQQEAAARYAVINKLPVRFGGWTQDVEKALSHHRYAFVSRYLAILEAMQSKRLVVAVYNNEIKRDYLTCHPQAKNMLVAGTGKEVAEQLQQLSKEDEKEMIHRAYLWAKEQTWSTLTERYLHLWTG